MSTIEITRFHSGERGYNKADASKVPLDTSNRLSAVVQHVENAVAQLRFGQGEPRGLSFAAYKGTRCVNKDANITGVYALALDYRVEQFEALTIAAERLGYAHLFILTENRARTLNAVTLVIPFAAPLSVTQYARIASCFAAELNIYGLLEGALAATHIVNVHATTATAFVRGELLDGEAYIKRTANQFQRQDARKYEGQESIGSKAARAQVERPFYTTDDGLWEMPLTDADLIVLKAHKAIHGTAPDLTAYGQIIDDGRS
jgi:hypothetical protein